MTVDDGIFYQPVQACFQFVQNHLLYMNKSNIDLFRHEAEELVGKGIARSWSRWYSSCALTMKTVAYMWSKCALVNLPSNAQMQKCAMST